MQTFDLRTIALTPHLPEVLDSADGEGRAIALVLPAGEQLQEHEVRQRGYYLVVDGEIEVAGAEGTQAGGPGALFVFAPHERREVTATTEARLLLVLAPWQPGGGAPEGTPVQ